MLQSSSTKYETVHDYHFKKVVEDFESPLELDATYQRQISAIALEEPQVG
jgi:hypothetical protein